MGEGTRVRERERVDELFFGFLFLAGDAAAVFFTAFPFQRARVCVCGREKKRKKKKGLTRHASMCGAQDRHKL
jgi:hypothetical protein